ncbi:hypothetical protein QE422_003953 [Chryseobacterium sp. SORGH_AS 447]|uniref:hypothetical protein n=1 Tax=Chryseobacterium sp. SORGH_AS_0447 TaxID=3041769 RepID=UPI002782270A|nr:hypothetical protein [Chryseobacterium sp. SORGH_AS_0447]MDQ1163585.1 hypothetical protein [Chryseobacterium sp. SORGH_AS_0447]
MKRKIILRLSYLIAFLTVFWSCHNEDFANGKAEPQRNNANFFLHSTKGGAAARGGVDYVSILETYNREKDFLSTMSDQQGMPIWDKMQVLDNGEKTVLYVPLSADRNGLSSLLIVNIDEENAVSRLQNFTNGYLEAYVYNADNPTAKRKLLMDTFLQMDFFTFGHQEFTNLPKDIYKGSTEYNRLNILDAKIQVEQNRGFIYNTICTTYHYCVHGHSASNCDYGHCTCGGLISCFMVTSCTTSATWIDDDPFPSFPGGGGGGGGPGGCNSCPTNTPPKDPCMMNTVFYRIKPGCLGNAGDPGIDDLDDPCVKTKKMFQKPKVQQAIRDVSSQAKQAALDVNEGEIGRIEKNGDFYPADVSEDHHVTFNNINGATGIYHNHTYNGAKIHSPADIYSILNFAQQQPSSNYGDAYVGMIGAQKCYPVVAGCYRMFHYLIRFSGTTADLSQSFTEDEILKFEKDYKDLESELREKPLFVDFLGDVTLNKKGYEKLFFETLAKMGLSNKVILQRVDDDDKIYNINLDANGIPEAIPCP